METPGYPSYAMASFLSRRLPLPFSYWIGMRIADRFYRRDRAGRTGVMANLTRIHEYQGISPSRGAIDGLARKTYQYFGKYLIDFFRYSMASRENLEKRVSIEHLDYLTGAIERGRGVLVATAHVGNWEMGGLMLSRMGFPVTAVVRPYGNPRLDRMFDEHRRRRGIAVLPLGRAVRGIVGTLRRGGITAVLTDRDFSSHRDLVTFFGRPARMPRGLAFPFMSGPNAWTRQPGPVP